MRIFIFTVLALLVNHSFAQTPEISAPQQCRVNSPYIAPARLPTLAQIIDNNQLVIVSDHTEIRYPDNLKYRGNIEFSRGDTFIRAQQAEINRKTNIFKASGNLHYQDDAITLNSDSLSSSLESQDTELVNTKYWFNGMLIHGQADSFRVAQGRYLILDNANFTTCPDEQPDWSLNAKQIKVDIKKEWATVRRATLEVFEVPVFYFPYLTLPISDKRATGFLYPNLGSSSNNGVDISVPFYWNIAPEYDLTLTPRIMTNRGFQLASEFRYLTGQQQGLLNLEFLPSDESQDDQERYLAYWRHSGKIDQNWRIAAELTDISDDNYFNDIGSEYANKTDNLLTKSADLGYYQNNWWFNLKIQDIQVLGSQQSPYQLLPQLSFHSYQNPLNSYLEYDVFSELSYFTNSTEVDNEALRAHIEPTLRLPLNYAAGSLTTELSLLQTWYQQKDLNTNITDSISRTLPQFRVHAAINLERETRLFSQDYFQTLEPQIQYLYVPFEEQSQIKLYDSANLRDDYYGLFRARRFSGLDRIADANQITVGLTNRFRNSHNQEKFRLSIGQTFYLTPSRTTLDGLVVSDNTIDSSALASELDFQASDHWYFSGAIQLNEKTNAITQSKTTVDYRLGSDKLIQFSHRYVKDISDRQIDQLGIQGIWPINSDWTFIGNYYQDINLHRTIESFVGLQYESCCWAVRLQAYRQLNSNFELTNFSGTVNQEEFDSGIAFSFQIKGLGSTARLDAKEMLEDGLFSYRRPYYLKN